MLRFAKKVSQKKGASPGTLVHIGDRKIDRAKVRLIEYDPDTVFSLDVDDIDALPAVSESAPKTIWLNIDGLHDEKLIEIIGKKYNIHPLTLEDVLDTHHRPKAEPYGAYLYIVLKTLAYHGVGEPISAEQISLVIFPGGLISFQESMGEVFSGVMDRLDRGKGRMRSLGSDYLAYALIDAIVDQYFDILEKLGHDIESLEEELTGSPAANTMKRIHALRHEFIYLRKQIWPLREVIHSLTRDDSGLITEKTRVFLRDVYDHTIQVIDTIESYRDILSGYLDLYLSIVSYKMNEVMKVLTIIATIFIPITFVAGVYGMNFKYMPELDWPWGYGGAWGVMLLSVAAMLAYFKTKRWW